MLYLRGIMCIKVAVEKYLEHLDKVFRDEPAYFKYSEDESPAFHTFTYKDIPEKGMITGFTCGYSLVESPAGGNVRNEFLVSVDSDDISWVMAAADIGLKLRGKADFQIGDTINFNAKISKESEMSSFFIWYQGVINETHELICLPEWHLRILQLFPIYDDERLIINEHGPEWLMELVEDPSDIKRESVASKFRI
jgi:hypothetical protein